MLTCCVDKTLKTVLILRNDYAGSSSKFFNRTWTQYQQGFGSPTALYWIGLDNLYQLTRENCQVRFDLQGTGNTWYYAQYSSILVGDSSTNYTLTIGGVSGNIGYFGMTYHNGQQFSTYDADHDGWVGGNCARMYGGGFWFNNGCNGSHITTSTTSGDFMWYVNGVMSLKTVKVSLLC